MTKREYLKYNNLEAFDMLGNRIKPGDTVIINNYYSSTPKVGIVSHFTQTGKLAIEFTWEDYTGTTQKGHYYRLPNTTVKIKDGNNITDKDKVESQP